LYESFLVKIFATYHLVIFLAASKTILCSKNEININTYEKYKYNRKSVNKGPAISVAWKFIIDTSKVKAINTITTHFNVY